MYSAKSSGNNVYIYIYIYIYIYCLAIMDRRKFLLNVLELLENTRFFLMNRDSTRIETLSSFLLLVPGNSHSPKTRLCIAKYKTNSSFNFSIKSSNLTAPSSSRQIDDSCRSVLVMNFDTSEQLRSNGCGSVSIHFLSRIGTLIDAFTTDFGFGLAFATSFPVLMNSSTFSVGISCDDSVTYLLIPFTMRTHETVRSLNNDFDHDINAITSFVRTGFHIQDWADLRV